MSAATPTPGGAARYAGSRVLRVEDARLLTGKGTYVDDVQRPGMLHACFVRSPFAHARINGIDTSAALDLPGVRAVFTAADLHPDIRETWYSAIGKDVPDTPRPPLAEGEVKFVGDPVAVVIADSRYIAEDAVDLVDVDYEPLDSVADYNDALDSTVLVHAAYPGNIAGQMGGAPKSIVDDACADAAHVVEATIRQQAYVAVPMETRGIVVEWSGEELTIWAATQAPHEVRMFCARLLGIPEHSVRVIMRDTGGGFGQKTSPFREDMVMMLAARKVPAPIKWIEDRRENLLSAGMARREHGVCRMAFDADGHFVATLIDHVQDVGAYPIPWPVGTAMATGMFFTGPYKVPTGTFTTTCVFSNVAGRTAYRGPWQFETVAREIMVDIAARQIGLDPVELRRRNMLAIADLPYTNPIGIPYDSMSPLETFEEALRIIDHDGFRAEQEAARAAGRLVGIGTSSYVEPTSTGAMPYYATEGATIRIEPSGKVNVYVSGGSTGNSLETAAVQLAADALGVDIADVHTIQGDTALTPFGGGTGGSRSGSFLAGAIGETAKVLREKIVAIAAHQFEVAPEDIELGGGVAGVRGTPTKALTVREIADIAYFQTAKLPPGVAAGLEHSGRYTAQSMLVWANATHVCTVEVDPVTGHVKILRYVVAEDCGPMINPNIVEGQVEGGTVQGIGGALLEHMQWDADGNPLTTTFVDYLLPTTTEVPTIEHGHVVTMGPGPGGYKGVGEGGAIGAPAAVINAVADALAPLGVRITDLPLSPAAIVALIEQAEKG